jgi:hypothetical protein
LAEFSGARRELPLEAEQFAWKKHTSMVGACAGIPIVAPAACITVARPVRVGSSPLMKSHRRFDGDKLKPLSRACRGTLSIWAERAWCKLG